MQIGSWLLLLLLLPDLAATHAMANTAAEMCSECGRDGSGGREQKEWGSPWDRDGGTVGHCRCMPLTALRRKKKNENDPCPKADIAVVNHPTTHRSTH